MNDSERISEMRQLLRTAETTIEALRNHLELLTSAPEESTSDTQSLKQKAKNLNVIEEDRVIEGVFDGQNMIGPDGKQYPIPANYASKSKLVEGDILKLTITDDGSFIYKQIGPIERKKVIGKIMKDGAEWRALVDGKYYRILLASITYYKADEGDEVVVMLPKNREASWAAVENIIKVTDNPVLEGDEPFASEEDDLDLSEDAEGLEDISDDPSEEEAAEPEKESGERDENTEEDEFSLTF